MIFFSLFIVYLLVIFSTNLSILEKNKNSKKKCENNETGDC
jgi:hypothetical protein